MPRRAVLLALTLPLGAGLVAACSGEKRVFRDGDGGDRGGSTATDGSGGTGTGGASSGGTGGGAQSSTSSGGTGGGVASACTADADCTVGAMSMCDPSTHTCVECIAGADKDACVKGERCTPAGKCEVGCDSEADCDAPLTCDPVKQKCTGCKKDTDCPAGSICGGWATCVAGCSNEQGCPGGKQCCGAQCANLGVDVANCGGCGQVCPGGPNGAATCADGACALVCVGAFADCNGDPSDGCEHDTQQAGACGCTPNETQSCYTGSPGTAGVGACKAGTRTCSSDGAAWGPCEGQVVPASEALACGNGVDDDCNGVVDDAPDLDGDGWTKCNGDCCDSFSDGCSAPELVNPDAFDISGNGVDDDCSGGVDDDVTLCDAGLASDSSDPRDYAKAIDLCADALENPPPGDKHWGLISAGFFLADGTGSPNPSSRSIRSGFGANVAPQRGAKLAIIASGHAAAKDPPNNTNPSYAPSAWGEDMGTSCLPPADWFQANGDQFPSAPGCNAPTNPNANDSVMLKLRIRAPINAKSFNVSSFFYSAEYPEYVCTQYNDFFLTLLDSAFVPGWNETPNPADKNLAFYDAGGGKHYPVGVNLVATGLFKVCTNGMVGCLGVASPYTGCTSTSELVGTGFEDPDVGCEPNNAALGGGTGWLTTSGNVKPGETLELRFVIWDSSDHRYDSLALIDNFAWSTGGGDPGTHD